MLVSSCGWLAVLGRVKATHLKLRAEDAAYKKNADEFIVDLETKLSAEKVELTNSRAHNNVLSRRNLELSFDNDSLLARLKPFIVKRPRDAKGHFMPDQVAA
ncbi:hypothetical protein WP12_12180 [Sphingomonas sp. SRS2]|nr:hypothetical protein WP12_12180 [Sphingomonas sp. SRS2]